MLPLFGHLDVRPILLFGFDVDLEVVRHLEVAAHPGVFGHLVQVFLLVLFVASRTGANSQVKDLTADNFSTEKLKAEFKDFGLKCVKLSEHIIKLTFVQNKTEKDLKLEAFISKLNFIYATKTCITSIF